MKIELSTIKVKQFSIAIYLLAIIITPRLVNAFDFDNISGNLSVASEYITHGISYTTDRPVLQGGLSYSVSDRFYTGIWFSKVEFLGTYRLNGNRNLEFNYFAGYSIPISDTWSFNSVFSRYDYDGSTFANAYNYNELLLAFEYKNTLSVSTALSKDIFNSNEKTLAYEFNSQFPMPNDYIWTAGIGYSDLDKIQYMHNYSYWNLGIAKNYQSIAVDISYFQSSPGAQLMFGEERSEGRLALTISYQF